MNEHEVGRIVDFAISHPAVRGINFQPAFHAGRHPGHDPMQRMTIPDILRLIEEQTTGKFVVSDFIPVPCCFPTCNAVTYAFVDGDKVTPLPRIVNVYEYLDYITNRVVPDFSLEIRGALEGLWSSSSVAGSQKSLDQLSLSCQACGLPDAVTVGDLADHMLMIMAQDFMDPWTFNQKNLMKCCKEFLLPGGKQIPFCAYNTIGYREQARAQLEAMEPERRRARAEGRRFEPRPVTFSFDEAQRVSGEPAGGPAAAPRDAGEMKQCCARLYESEIVSRLLGESFHPGGIALTERLGQLLGLTPASRVLDAASGKGTSAVVLAQRFGCSVIGVDLSDSERELRER